ncbi:hypothetical protein [Embleya sp. NPDC005971]|uniref:hypothetical protein n=1 Tax=unclassified Embleya TaxID=2699296 RepID=UPI0034108291
MIPDDEYLLKLGRVTYGLALLESVILAELDQLPGLPPALATRKLAGKSIEAIARALTDSANTDKVADATTRAWLQVAGGELAAAGRIHHAIKHARAAEEGEQLHLHRRSGELGDAVDITTAWLQRAQSDLDDALRQVSEGRAKAA